MQIHTNKDTDFIPTILITYEDGSTTITSIKTLSKIVEESFHDDELKYLLTEAAR